MRADFMARCGTYQQGRCDGTKRTRCGTCGRPGHGNCYGNGDRPMDVPCEHGCHGRHEVIEELERDALATLAPLVAKLDATKEATDNAFAFCANHGMLYDGPTYADELNAARDAIVALREAEEAK